MLSVASAAVLIRGMPGLAIHYISVVVAAAAVGTLSIRFDRFATHGVLERDERGTRKCTIMAAESDMA